MIIGFKKRHQWKYDLSTLVGIACILLSGCSTGTQRITMQQIMNSWMGSHISQVIMKWGPPNEIVTDGAGGHIYIWYTVVTIPPPAPQQPQGTARRGLADHSELIRTIQEQERLRQQAQRRMFYVRPDGTIHHWLTRGF